MSTGDDNTSAASPPSCPAWIIRRRRWGGWGLWVAGRGLWMGGRGLWVGSSWLLKLRLFCVHINPTFLSSKIRCIVKPEALLAFFLIFNRIIFVICIMLHTTVCMIYCIYLICKQSIHCLPIYYLILHVSGTYKQHTSLHLDVNICWNHGHVWVFFLFYF